MPMSSVLAMSATGLGSCPPTRWLPLAVWALTAHPAASSVACCHRSDSPDSVGDVSALSVVSSRACGASVTFGIADSASSMGASVLRAQRDRGDRLAIGRAQLRLQRLAR